MSDFPEAYTVDNLVDVIDANDSCPSISVDEAERLVGLARQRADARGEESTLDDREIECVIATDWTGFCEDEFGYDNDALNQFAMGIFNGRASAGKGADLFTDVVVVQDGWLRTGDGRRSQVETYVDEDYDGSDDGEMWLPNGAQDYVAVFVLTGELIHGSPDASEAM